MSEQGRSQPQEGELAVGIDSKVELEQTFLVRADLERVSLD